MTVLDKQIINMCELSEQLILMNQTLPKTTAKNRTGILEMVCATFDLWHGQDIGNLNRASIPRAGAEPAAVTGPQLPVLALKPDRLFSPCPQLTYVSGRKPSALITEPVILTVIPLWNNKLSSSITSTMKSPSDSGGRQLICTTPIFLDDNHGSCLSILNVTFYKCHPLHQKRKQFINFQQFTLQDTLETREHLFILMKVADVDRMGQESCAW